MTRTLPAPAAHPASRWALRPHGKTSTQASHQRSAFISRANPRSATGCCQHCGGRPRRRAGARSSNSWRRRPSSRHQAQPTTAIHGRHRAQSERHPHTRQSSMVIHKVNASAISVRKNTTDMNHDPAMSS